jgi:hypothetical protein
VADREEQPGRVDRPLAAGLEIADRDLLHDVAAGDRGDLVRQQELDLGVRARAILHDLRRPQLVAAVDQVDLGTRTW